MYGPIWDPTASPGARRDPTGPWRTAGGTVGPRLIGASPVWAARNSYWRQPRLLVFLKEAFRFDFTVRPGTAGSHSASAQAALPTTISAKGLYFREIDDRVHETWLLALCQMSEEGRMTMGYY